MNLELSNSAVSQKITKQSHTVDPPPPWDTNGPQMPIYTDLVAGVADAIRLDQTHCRQSRTPFEFERPGGKNNKKKLLHPFTKTLRVGI